MTEILFYHLDRRPLDTVLPTLLEKTLARGWTAVVQCGSAERIEALDALLWTFRDESFLPHGRAGDPHETDQPVLLTQTDSNPARAPVRFLVDGTPFPSDTDGYTRIVVLFDGNDDQALGTARGQWKQARDAGHGTTYWQQDERGTWVRKA
jgi:DNA polymerase-3 subunit chi